MLQVDYEIEQDDPKHYRQPRGRVQHREQSPPLGFDKEGQSNRGYGKEETNEKRIERDDPDVARPPPASPDLLSPARCKDFARRHQRKDAGKGHEPDQRLV